MQAPHVIASFLISAARILPSAAEPSGYIKEPGAFYPPDEEVQG